MKQCITQQQWNKLNPEEMAKFFIMFNRKYIKEEWFKYCRCETVKRRIFDFRPNIGQMIDFLGDDLLCIEPYLLGNESKTCNGWSVSIKQIDVFAKPRSRKGSCVCDALWKAVKYKLNNET